ncbi:MAG: hypothetical protein WAW03_02695 [Anaerolineae bacterium]|jgi:hypothetical protein|uniref:hypothetical protein n=1 Tax=Candidatus Amarolinea dominans TaxID=3140696 RepID=UPI001D302803|nr:hypothetical protein [Anaerolineae bacterium]MBK7204060.1 hypothetical protein [Anaerolineae bacterium]MBK9093014.1 hypothetical protein [Anaerolineae bacterium]MBK9232820.1 hypothetical protein [Anaerolineae bacterium]
MQSPDDQDQAMGVAPWEERQPNGFGCIFIGTGGAFAILTVLSFIFFQRTGLFDVVSLGLILFVAIFAVAQIWLGVWLLRGARSAR